MLTLTVFLLSVYGLANAIAMLKIGVYFFGDHIDQVVLKDGTKISWKKISRKTLDTLEVEDTSGSWRSIRKADVACVLAKKGLGRIPYVGEMFYCPACLSFWIGMAASKWIVSPTIQICGVTWKAVLLDGLMACAVSWLLHAVSMRLTSGVEDV